MSATPALWTARVILASALGIGIAVVAVNRQREAAPAVAATLPPPVAVPAAPVRPRPAPTPSPTPETYEIKRILDTGGPIKYGAWFWDDKDVPAGRVIVTVDLEANVLSVFRAGYEVGTAAVIYGADSKPTPTGVYPVIGKDADHVSNLYDAPMPYMLRLTNDGISIHGSKVAFDAATHGCIGIPTPFARKLFALIRLGDQVIVTRGEKLDLGQSVAAAKPT
jgi:lipoprotein-anchoring transpeptidase ErfK/SrfK